MMRTRAAAAAAAILTGCASPRAEADIGMSRGSSAVARQVRADSLAALVLSCAEEFGRMDTVPNSRCTRRDAMVTAVGHVPPVVATSPHHNVAEVLSYFVALDLGPAEFRTELVMVDQARAVVTGAVIPTDAPTTAFPAGAWIDLGEDGRATAIRLYFDQRAKDMGSFPSDDGTWPRLLTPTRQAENHRRLAAATLRGTQGEPLAAGDHVATESAGALIIARVDADGISEQRTYASAYRAGIAAGHAEPPPSRPNAVSIRRASAIEVYEGLPHQAFEADKLVAEQRRKPWVAYHGYPFYKPVQTPQSEHAQWLTEILVSKMSVKPFGGEKRCGGFHPDYLVAWTVDGQRFDALICFGCGELKWIEPNGTQTRYDFHPWAKFSLRTVLGKYARERPPRSFGSKIP